MRQAVSVSAALAGCLMMATAGTAQTEAGREQVARQEVKDAMRVLLRQLDALHDEIVTSLAAVGARDVFTHAQNVLGNFVLMDKALQQNASVERLRQDYARAAQSLHELLPFVEGRGPSYGALDRAAARVRAADRELHFAIYGNLPDAHGGEVLGRQARGLLEAAQNLQKTSAYALAGVTTAGDLFAELRLFGRATRDFNQAVKQKKSQDELRQSFREVISSWDHVVLRLRRLPPRDNVYILRNATQVDTIQERLFVILSMPGKRSRLPASSE